MAEEGRSISVYLSKSTLTRLNSILGFAGRDATGRLAVNPSALVDGLLSQMLDDIEGEAGGLEGFAKGIISNVKEGSNVPGAERAEGEAAPPQAGTEAKA